MPELGRILIADDEVGFAAVTADLLREEGYACDCATDAFAAKTMLEEGRYELLVADIKMPGNDGLQFVETLPAIAPGLPVILVTGYPSLDTAIKSTRLAVAGYLMKPVNLDEFLKLVRESVIRYQTFRQFQQAREELQKRELEMVALKDLAGVHPSFVNVDVFLHHTIKNILASVGDLRELAQALAQDKPKQQVCQLISCPRHAELADVIEHAISVLEKTKGSFKSKELAALRLRLERVIGTGTTA